MKSSGENSERKQNKKNEEIKETVVYNELGDELHVFDGENGKVVIKKLHMSVWQPTGEQWCPECRKRIKHKDGYWECEKCNYSIDDEEVEYSGGYPSLESTYENDYETYFENQVSSDDDEL